MPQHRNHTPAAWTVVSRPPVHMAMPALAPGDRRPSRLPVEEFARDDHLPHVLGEVRDRVDEELEHGGLTTAPGRRDHARQIGRGQRGQRVAYPRVEVARR